jgi:hypothetical protein
MPAERGEDGANAAWAADEGHARPPGDEAGGRGGDGGRGDGGRGDGGRRADAARARLGDLQQSAAEAYAAIAAADDALRVFALRRVAAERGLRLAAARHAAASRAAAAHARARPGPIAQLATGFRARREWRQQQPAFAAALTAADRQLGTARRALSEAKDDFTARLAARAAAAATLLRLTAQCAAERAEIAAADGAGAADGDSAASLRGTGEVRWDNSWRA